MESIKELLKKNKYELYKVFKKHRYLLIPNDLLPGEKYIPIDTGLYVVEAELCRDEEEYKRVISNFSHIAKDDHNAVILSNELLANYMKFYLNEQECKNALLKIDSCAYRSELMINDFDRKILKDIEDCTSNKE